MEYINELKERKKTIKSGGTEKYHQRNEQRGKLFVRERLNALFDDGLTSEDGVFANFLADDHLPADGIVTGIGQVNNRKVAVIANDSTVKAGSWGERTVEKILRTQETALKLEIPIIYLVDSAGARITDQLHMFPGRRGAGRIFHNQIKLSGRVPQVCLMFGPSAAGGAYIPAFSDVVVMVEGNASMYLGSPRMAEKVIGEKVSLEEMGGAKMHCSVSGCADVLVHSEEEALKFCRNYLSYFPDNFRSRPSKVKVDSTVHFDKTIDELIPTNQNVPFNMYDLIDRIVDGNSFCEIKQLFAQEIITGLARIEGESVGIIANQPKVKGGVLFPDSADKAAKFIQLCDAFNIPLLFLVDVPGFMIGTQVERAGIIRHGAKMIASMSEATVPKISLIVRKAYGAGLYAMAGPAFDPDCTLAYPTAQIAVMGPEAAVNAVYANKINELDSDERTEFIKQKHGEYKKDIDIYRLASELIVDDIINPNYTRQELANRFELYKTKHVQFTERKHGVYPV